ncbi:hypothetical protein NIES2135_67640 (plasmid) [Leptolyngbya boryana NIES-2135]|jgi:chemotaxis protein histidine kinase CheA|uniref:Outer membrane lipoprotein BamD-like domain-containing protein n=1 Tax=Leptolyngbya boryana NIES-2135 TaxID=1973484 RepID=A0A1Z4JT55_LEPBY|nr:MULTISPECIES: hypothetical protein [Leptolyngbya]BAY59887.1 hypothetical protein NIES2135_67640 [Leptolyngbya boryana NIES-2135]MBD2369561.1 hypothetical protein [Leptolyngbya sp. FACHB-161]MBD2375994.1 hypothetical protein [Leptolyngbya sp. FACHB-238]MBD2400270.1 hypothetical protein [Leptolyngbya sp. FACHB-239]MBD2406812.1 hypothetical protein [Leptolyngbya sp. FACHB-402]
MLRQITKIFYGHQRLQLNSCRFFWNNPILKKVLSICLLIVLAIGCASCDSEDISDLQSQIYYLRSQKTDLEQKIAAKEEALRKQSEQLYSMAKQYNSINAYELFLQNGYSLPDFKTKAVSYIYDLTRKADLIEGYQYFLKRYPNAPQAKEANHRLYEVVYKIAEKKNTLPAYTTFLSTFTAAPNDLRETALNNAVSLKCQELSQEYQKSISQKQNDETLRDFTVEVFREFTVDKIGRRIYEEAISNKDKGDNVSFSEDYNTILKCSLFNSSNTKFSLLRDAELSKEIENIENQLKQIRQDLAKSNELVLSQLSSIQSAQNFQNNYVQEISMIVKEQSHILKQMQEPLAWDANESAWQNFCRIGMNAASVLPVSELFFGGQSKA